MIRSLYYAVLLNFATAIRTMTPETETVEEAQSIEMERETKVRTKQKQNIPSVVVVMNYHANVQQYFVLINASLRL